MSDQEKPKALKIPRIFNGKAIRLFHTSKHNPIYTKSYADSRQKFHQAKTNPPIKKLKVIPIKEEIKVTKEESKEPIKQDAISYNVGKDILHLLE